MGTTPWPKPAQWRHALARARERVTCPGESQANTEKPWPEGGWHIKLMWNELKEKVPTNEQDAIRRFLSTERQISKSPSALRSFNEQVAKCLALGYFVLAKDFPHKEAVEGKQSSFLPLSYALKDTVETAESDEPTDFEPTQLEQNQGTPSLRCFTQGKRTNSKCE